MLVRPTLALRDIAYGWMVTPGIVEHMMGPPTYPDNPVPSLAEFRDDWTPNYWTHDRPEAGRLFLIAADGELTGCIAHSEVLMAGDGRRTVELDIWVAQPALIGRGYGRNAIAMICARVHGDLAVRTVFLQPSARNPIALRSYAAAGFVRSELPATAAAEFYRTAPDYPDSVFLIKTIG